VGSIKRLAAEVADIGDQLAETRVFILDSMENGFQIR